MTSFLSLNWNLLTVFYLSVIFIISFLVTFLTIPILIKYMKKKGHVGLDIHKNSKPEVAESGGISLLIGISVACSLLMIFFPIFINIILIFVLTVILAGIIGFIDDKVRLRSRYKIALTIFIGSIIFLANMFRFIQISSPMLPFLGQTRLTIIYPILIPLIVAILANTVNMLEGYNGEGSGTCLIAVCFLFICGLILFSAEAIIFTIPVIAVLLAFFIYNKYPAKVFPGDVGTLSIGAMIACIALFSSLEVAVFCVLLMHIFNSFYVLSSVRGFFESSEIQSIKEDIIVLEDDRIAASFQRDAALTLPRLLLAKGPLTEKELVENMFAVSIICGLFSIITSILIVWSTLGSFILIISVIILCLPTFFIMYKYPRIRGIVVSMMILLVSGMILLVFIDMFIITLPSVDIYLIIIKVPLNILLSLLLFIPGLFLWYYISVKWFWRLIKNYKIINKSEINEL